jgi:hypothetical protein
MPGSGLSLRQALQQSCDPALVERVRSEERRLTEYELNQTSRIQLTPLTERRQPTSTSWMVDTDLTNWSAAWRALEDDLRQRIGAGQIHVYGVQAKPQRLTHRQPIQSAWAADMKFDFALGVIVVDDHRYTAVVCSPHGPLAEPVAEIMPTAEPVGEAAPTVIPVHGLATALTDEQVAMLDAASVARLLERHAEQVVRGQAKNLLTPGKASPVALVAAKMKDRARQGDLLPTLANEADWLSAWAAQVAPAYQTPKPKTITNKLWSLYQELRGKGGPGETRSPPGGTGDGKQAGADR